MMIIKANISSFAWTFARERNRYRTLAVVWHAEGAHFEEAPLFDAYVHRPPEHRELRLGPLKSKFIAKTFVRRLFWFISNDFGAVCAWNASRSPKSSKNPQTPTSVFKVIQALSANRKPVYYFLLVISK